MYIRGRSICNRLEDEGKKPRGCKSVEEGQGQTPRFRVRSMVCSFVTARSC